MQATTANSLSQAGFHNRLRQPDQILTIRLDNCPPAIEWEAFDAWLLKKLALPVSGGPDGGVPGHDATGLMWRILHIAAGLQRAARIPIFEPGRILSCEADPAQPGAWFFKVAVPRVDYMFTQSTYLAYNSATLLALEVAAAPSRFTEPEPLYQQLDENVLQPLRQALPVGKSSIHVLRTAHERRIPWRHIGQGVFQLGWGRHALLFRHSRVESDSSIGVDAAQHKFVAAQWMRLMGLPVSEHRLVTEEGDALQAAASVGWPLVVKPANRDRGEGVTVDIDSENTLRSAFRHAVQFSEQVLVERAAPGVCHRLLVVRGKVLYTVKRLPISVEGDGRKTIAECIEAGNARQKAMPAWDRPLPYPADDLARDALGRCGLRMESVLASGAWAPLRRIESTEWGGLDEDFSATLHADNAAIAIQAASLFGLDVAGVDIISPDITRPWHENGAIINEINSAPLLGASQSSLDTLPALMAQLVSGEGRIPIEVIVGADRALTRARARQQYWVAKGCSCYVTSHIITEDPGGHALPLAVRGLFARCIALLMNKNVGAIVLVAQTDELLDAGLPVDRFDLAERIPGEFVASSFSHVPEAERTDKLFQLLASSAF